MCESAGARTKPGSVTDIMEGICDQGERLCAEPDDELGDEEDARDDDGRDEALFLGDLEAHHIELKSTTKLKRQTRITAIPAF